MRPITATVTPPATQALVNLDPWHGSSLGVQIVPSGGAQFTLDYSLDDPNDLVNPVPLGSMNFSSSMIPAGAVGGSTGLTFSMPASPIWARLRLLNGVGSVRATFLQPHLDSGVKVISASGITFPPLPAGALGVWSLRKTSAVYAGNCIRVAAAGTTTPFLDVGFSANNWVNFAAAIAFCAPAPVTVLTWYDQSGTNNHLTSAASGNAPQLEVINGVPWLAFTNYQGNTASPAILAAAAAIPMTGDMTLGMMMQLGTDGSQTANLTSLYCCADGTNGYWWVANNSAPGVMSMIIGGSTFNATSGNLLTASVNAVAFTRTGTTFAFYQNGANVGTVAGSVNLTNASPFTLGGFNPTTANYYLEGLVGEGYIYSSALSSAQVSALASNQAATFPKTGFETFWNGSASVQFGFQETIAMGNVLAFDRGQVWTLFGLIQLYSSMGWPGDNAILSNIPHSAPFPGWGVLMTSQGGRYGVLHLLLVNTLGSNAIELFGTTNLTDGKKHMIAVSYDGSSTAAGFKAYIDGVAETLNITQNTLSATIIGAGQSLNAGSQIADPLNYLRGTLGFVQLDFAVRSQGYIQGCTSLATTPNDATFTQFRLNLTAGSGITAADTGAVGHAFAGTLTSAGMWRH